MSKRPSADDILKRVHNKAQDSGINLTFTNLRVYLGLLDYAKKHKKLVVKSVHGFRFNATTFELAEYCAVSPRMITDSLQKYKACGVIKYEIYKPKPSVITLCKEFYE